MAVRIAEANIASVAKVINPPRMKKALILHDPETGNTRVSFEGALEQALTGASIAQGIRPPEGSALRKTVLFEGDRLQVTKYNFGEIDAEVSGERISEYRSQLQEILRGTKEVSGKKRDPKVAAVLKVLQSLSIDIRDNPDEFRIEFVD